MYALHVLSSVSEYVTLDAKDVIFTLSRDLRLKPISLGE